MYWIDKAARTSLGTVLIFALVLTAIRFAVFFYLEKTPKHKRTGAYSGARVVNELSDALIYAAIVVFMLVRPFAIQTFWIPSGSMIDTLHLNDYIVANKFVYRVSEPVAGDIVVFSPPESSQQHGQPIVEDYIKRLIGVPGDLIEIRDRVMYRNGVAVSEPHVVFTDFSREKVLPKDMWKDADYDDFKLIDVDGVAVPILLSPSGDAHLGANHPGLADLDHSTNLISQALSADPIKIPDGYFLFMGDNRNGSWDGRSWGLVERDSIIGRAECIWFPFSRWTRTPRAQFPPIQ
jgi:signal peptidase I